MPPATRITKDNILDAAYEIVRVEGMEGVNARAIAKRLNCSIQPIFYQFTHMDELKNELFKKISQTYLEYIHQNVNQTVPYKEIGKGYIRFAKEEPILFRLLFMSDSQGAQERYTQREQSFYDVLKYAKECTHLNEKKIEDFHVRMWIFTHGIATMLATKAFYFTDEQIDQLLTEEFEALMLLEKEKEK